MLLLIPAMSMAAQVTLAWDANNPEPDGYRVFQRVKGQAYDYSNPVWPSDGADHRETTCLISNLSPGTTYYYVVRAYVGDDQSGDSNEAAYQTAIPANDQSPVAEAGTNQTVAAGSLVTLNGTGSSDPDGDAITYQWTQTSGQSVSLINAASALCTFTAPLPTTGAVTLAFEITVTDINGQVSKDTCLVLVEQQVEQLPDNDGDGTIDDLDPDDDNDGMPDTWEILYNLDPFTNDANGDADKDGVSNLQEYQTGSNPTQVDGNNPPDQPVMITPVDGAQAVGLSPRLKAGLFNDPDAGDIHAKTQWQIVYNTSTQTIVLDRTNEGAHLTDMRVPRLILEPSTGYIVRVRYFDNHGEPSPWSSPVSFTTESDAKDKNKNHIPDTQEVSAVTDMNADTIPDNDQANIIKTVATYDNLNIESVAVNEDEAMPTVEAAANIDPATLDTSGDVDGSLPLGLLAYKIKVAEPGQGTHVTIYLSDAIVAQQNEWVRYDETTGLQTCATSAIVDESGSQIDRYLVDGGDQDADGAANGVIVDVSGPRSTTSGDASSLAITSDGEAAAGTGSSGGCFIQTLF